MRLFCHVGLLAGLSFLLLDAQAQAQFAGVRGGVAEGNSWGDQQLAAPSLTKDMIQGFITVEGRAEVRVAPTEIRIVLAVTAEAETPQACQAQAEQIIAELKNSWRALGVLDNATEGDFIAVLPRYKFELVEQAEERMAVERKSGYLLQTNLHVAVRDDLLAMAVLKAAFSSGVADIIAFDYWNNAIEQHKKQVRSSAIAAAKEKSALLLAVFEATPPLVNISETTQVIYPETLYQSPLTKFTPFEQDDWGNSGLNRRVGQMCGS